MTGADDDRKLSPMMLRMASTPGIRPNSPTLTMMGARVATNNWPAVSRLTAAFAAEFLAGLQLPSAMSAHSGSPWVSAIANYQALYVRATVDQPADDPARVQRLLNDFAATTQGSIPVPDLREAGLSFKRIQRLGYENRPLLQMIFLPAEGMPTALCVVPAQLEDTTIAQSALNGMQVVSWHRRGMSYVLVTALPENTAHSVAVKLLEGKFPALYQS